MGGRSGFQSLQGHNKVFLDNTLYWHNTIASLQSGIHIDATELSEQLDEMLGDKLCWIDILAWGSYNALSHFMQQRLGLYIFFISHLKGFKHFLNNKLQMMFPMFLRAV